MRHPCRAVLGLGARPPVVLRSTARLSSTLFALGAFAVLLLAGFAAYFAIGSKRVLEDVLMAQRDGKPMPANVEFDSTHLSVRTRAEGQLSQYLSAGFLVSRRNMMWEALPRLAASYSIDIQEDIDFVCEVYRGKAWLIACGQLRCASGDPCEFETADGNRYRVVHEPPNNALEPLRER